MRWISVIVWLWCVLPVWGQELQVSNFVRLKKGLLNHNQVVTDKKLATLDFTTTEKGFSFLANGTTEVKAEEGDNQVTLKVPHKTTFLLIKHPAYRELYWKVPGKGLRKKKHYQAMLLSDSLDVEKKKQQQVVEMNILPENAIVWVDSTRMVTRDGLVKLKLDKGKHAYKVESPFHEEATGEIEVGDEALKPVVVSLEPIYSYLTVKAAADCQIVVDGIIIGQGEATSGKLLEGKHRVQLVRKDECIYDNEIEIGKGEKKELTI